MHPWRAVHEHMEIHISKHTHTCVVSAWRFTVHFANGKAVSDSLSFVSQLICETKMPPNSK